MKLTRHLLAVCDERVERVVGKLVEVLRRPPVPLAGRVVDQRLERDVRELAVEVGDRLGDVAQRLQRAFALLHGPFHMPPVTATACPATPPG